MKMTKKKVLVVALAFCLAAIISMGTLAWFSASDSVNNNFFIADSEHTDPSDIFSVTVWENTPDADEVESGYDYTNILPGDLLKKEVRVQNTGYYAQYVRVIVTISDAEAWINALGADFNAADVFDGFNADQWTHVWNNLSEATEMPEDIIYVLYYNGILENGDVIEVFDNVKIPTTLTVDQAAAFGGSFSITVKAQAVQTENVVPEGTADADKAWAAFNTVGMGIGA